MDYVDLTIVGTIMMCFGFAAGIIISANKPKKEKTLIPNEASEINARLLVEEFLPLVDSEEAGPTGFVFSREKKVANAKSCALIAMKLLEEELTTYGLENDELQNMDAEWRYIDNLKKAIEQYNG